MKKKNGYIELLRFIMCVVIVLHHSGFVADSSIRMPFPFGALAADFFFMVTGYFAYAHLLKKENAESSMTEKESMTMRYWMKYTLGKLKRVLPYAALGIVAIYVLEFFWPTEELPIIDRLMRLQNMPFELTLTPMLGVIAIDLFNYRNAPLWFLSSMLIALPPLMFLIKKYRDVFSSYLVWFLPALLQAWMVVTYGGVCPWTQFSGLIYCGVIRAFGDMMMGCAIYIAARALENKLKDSKAGKKVLLTILEVGMLVFILLEFHRGLAAYDQIFVLYIIELMLIITMSGMSYTSKIGGSVFEFLGKLSMPIYCVHWAIYQYVAKFIVGIGYWEGIALTFAISVVVSTILLLVIASIGKKKQLS